MSTRTPHRILLKLSGESLAAGSGHGIDPGRLADYAQEIEQVHKLGKEIAIVIGGGNIFRGLKGAAQGLDRVTGDKMGMLATVINSLALASQLQQCGLPSAVFTAYPMIPFARPFSHENIDAWLHDGGIAILAGGTGNPFFTTDTAAALRAVELKADLLLKGTRVDGIYTADPEKDPSAQRFEHITYDEVYARDLKVMDLTATTLCKENNLSCVVFNMDKPGNLTQLLSGEKIGTLVTN